MQAVGLCVTDAELAILRMRVLDLRARSGLSKQQPAYGAPGK